MEREETETEETEAETFGFGFSFSFFLLQSMEGDFIWSWLHRPGMTPALTYHSFFERNFSMKGHQLT